jgi:hypothetical protein
MTTNEICREIALLEYAMVRQIQNGDRDPATRAAEIEAITLTLTAKQVELVALVRKEAELIGVSAVFEKLAS